MAGRRVARHPQRARPRVTGLAAPGLMPLVTADDDPLGVEDFATHRVPLEEAPHAYPPVHLVW